MTPEDYGKLLVKHGFIKKSAASKYALQEDGTYKPAKIKEIDPADADREEGEQVSVQPYLEGKFTSYIKTAYPDPLKRYRLIVEAASSKISIEETYYWLLNYLRRDAHFPYIEKLTDVFSASEQSSFWGAAQSRMSLQQDRASQYFKGMSEMIKQLFQLVRELRVLDEKLEPRNQWSDVKAADVALKGEYSDLVENRGGQVQPGSIYHLAQQVGYAILPDLFFNTHVYKLEDIDKKIDDMKYNKNVKNVLRRKLYAFINWKLRTDQELKNRRNFTLKYLRQHWNVIKTYMNWVKPYLRNIARMQMKQEHLESPDIISAFETAMIEIELLVYKPSQTSYHPCVLLTFEYRTSPEMSFQQDQYAHKGPSHYGKVEVNFRGYTWTKDQINAYKKLKREEDLLLLSTVDDSVKSAMDALGEELENYLAEAGEKEFEEKKKATENEKKKKPETPGMASSMGDPFISLFRGFGEMFSLVIPSKRGKSKKAKTKGKPGDAEGVVASQMYQMFKNYKKAHNMLSW